MQICVFEPKSEINVPSNIRIRSEIVHKTWPNSAFNEVVQSEHILTQCKCVLIFPNFFQEIHSLLSIPQRHEPQNGLIRWFSEPAETLQTAQFTPGINEILCWRQILRKVQHKRVFGDQIGLGSNGLHQISHSVNFPETVPQVASSDDFLRVGVFQEVVGCSELLYYFVVFASEVFPLGWECLEILCFQFRQWRKINPIVAFESTSRNKWPWERTSRFRNRDWSELCSLF